MRLYSPYMDGPSKLATSVMSVNDNRASFQTIDRALGREVACTVHLPPSMHVFLSGPGFTLLNLLPRPAEKTAGVKWFAT